MRFKLSAGAVTVKSQGSDGATTSQIMNRWEE
jgi:hypothetical protein